MDPVPDNELRTSRLFDVSPERVYRAFIEPASLARWWGPKGFTNEVEICEPKPGGQWKFVMVSPAHARYPNEAVFAELVPGRRVVIDHVSPPQFQLIGLFEPEGNRTRVTWRQIFPSKDSCDKVRHFAVPANEENLDRLATVLEL